MNSEEDEFKRIEREAKRRAQAADDDDTQVYTSNVALDNEQAAKIEQGCKESWVTEQAWQSAVWWAEAALKEKNT